MNLFEGLPGKALAEEQFTDILKNESVRIERIVSQGHTSPATGWYCQDQHEWVLVLEGAAVLTFEDGSEKRLGKGDYLLIEKQQKHRVSWTDPDRLTVWLAVFFGG